MTKAAVRFDHAELEDVRVAIAHWLEASDGGHMDGEEMLSRLGGIAEQLDEAIMRLRRALGW